MIGGRVPRLKCANPLLAAEKGPSCGGIFIAAKRDRGDAHCQVLSLR